MIPEATIRRLSIYLRCLRHSLEEGEEIVLSSEIAKRCGISSSLVRKDLSYFGEFGIKGRGYRTGELISAIEKIIGIHDKIGIIIIGAGNLGRALIRHLNEIPYFYIIAAFDKNQEKCGISIDGVEVFHISQLSEITKKTRPEVAVLAIPPDSLQETLDWLAAHGIKGILSFALSSVKTPKNVELGFVEIAAEIEYLLYKINRRRGTTK